MPNPAATASLRHCLRSTTSSLRCANTSSSTAARRCVATAICPAKQRDSLVHVSSPSSNTSTKARRPHTHLGVSSPRPLREQRMYSSTPTPSAAEAVTPPAEKSGLQRPTDMNEAETEVFGLLEKELQPTELSVKDISGGCGSMYGIEITSERFNGLGVLKQQRLVNEVLGERVKGWHGVQLRTRGT